jgi:transcriptional regulator with XRE-family HTH domain
MRNGYEQAVGAKPSAGGREGIEKELRMAKKAGPRSVGKADRDMGQRIRLRRVELKMTQDQLAEALGVSFQQVQKYEKGVNRVGSARLEQIAAALKVPISFFYDGGKAGQKQQEVESLLFLDAPTSLRLLRADKAIKDQTVRRRFVTLVEGLAATASDTGE